MAEEVRDIKLDLEKKCLAEKCQKYVHHYKQCCDRIKDVPFEKEPHCFPQYYEVIHCVDVCVDKDLWKTLQ